MCGRCQLGVLSPFVLYEPELDRLRSRNHSALGLGRQAGVEFGFRICATSGCNGRGIEIANRSTTTAGSPRFLPDARNETSDPALVHGKSATSGSRRQKYSLSVRENSQNPPQQYRIPTSFLFTRWRAVRTIPSSGGDTPRTLPRTHQLLGSRRSVPFDSLRLGSRLIGHSARLG